MIVGSVMTKNPVYIRPDMSVADAKALMVKEKVNKLPVLDKSEKLVGILTKRNLNDAGPSVATTLDMYEISYLLAKLTVEKVMTKKVRTVQENEVVEEAARIMADEDIGCLPVMRGNLLVGIVTESDVFRFFIDIFGARYKGIRVVMLLDEKPGELARFTQGIAENKGNIVSLVTGEAENLSKRRCECKVTDIQLDKVEAVLKTVDAIVEDIRVI